MDSVNKSSPTGLAWKEKDAITLGPNALCYVGFNSISNGTAAGGTQLSYLNTYGGNTYDIDSDAYDATDADYYFDLRDTGIPDADLYTMGEFISALTISITISSDVAATPSDILIRTPGNNSWSSIYNGNLGISELERTPTLTEDISDYISNGIVRIKVNTSNPGFSHTISINCLNITLDYNNEYNSSSYWTGAAGIGNFYLDLYAQTRFTPYLNRARDAGDFIVEQAENIGGTSTWREKGSYYTGFGQGVAGIGAFLLDLYQVTSSISYRNIAIDAADWLNDNAISQQLGDNMTLRWGLENETSIYFTGMDYCAGIGQFLLDVGIEVGGNNIYKTNAAYVANLLTTQGFIVDLEQSFGYNVYYKWKKNDFTGGNDFTYSEGGSGALEFLNNLFLVNGSTSFSKSISGGLEWILKTINITNQYWDDDKEANSVPNGLAGVGLALLKINLKRPEISQDNVPTQLEYNEQLRVSFDIDTYYSNVQDILIRYAFGQDYILGVWTEDILTSEGGGIYSYIFSPTQYLTYNTTIHYAIIAIDTNESFSFDNNGYEYQLDVVDTIAPIMKITQLFDGLGADESGNLEISILKESARGAALDKVDINSPSLGIADSIPDTLFLDEGAYLTYTYGITTPKTASYGKKYPIDFIVFDVATNTRVVQSIIKIADKFPPQINFTETPIKWIPQFTQLEFEAKAFDIGSGIDDKEGVFVYYSTDDGNTWDIVYLEKKSGDKYTGTVPGQVLLVKVYYVLGAEDKEGNKIFIDKYGTTYDKFEDIELKAMEFSNIVTNWPMLLIIVGVIALIIIFGYLIYSKRGDYLTRMRRKSKATATGLAIKERFTNFYYKLYDKVNALGEKLAKSKDGFAQVGPWISDHFGEGTRKFFWTIGRILWALPKAIGNAIGNFFKGIGSLITKSKGYQIFLFMVFGLLILITTVVQFIMEGAYPLRAVFFANLGFLMFLTGVIILLLRFIYKLAYK